MSGGVEASNGTDAGPPTSYGRELLIMGIEEKLPAEVLLTTVEGIVGYFRKASPRPEMLLDAILKLHKKIQSEKLGVNKRNLLEEQERLALQGTPTSEMKGLLR